MWQGELHPCDIHSHHPADCCKTPWKDLDGEQGEPPSHGSSQGAMTGIEGTSPFGVSAKSIQSTPSLCSLFHSDRFDLFGLIGRKKNPKHYC